MKEAREQAASILTKDLKLWVTGGEYYHSDYDTTRLDTTEYIGLDGTVEQGVSFPHTLSMHCMATVLDANEDIDQTFIIGGTGKQTWIFDHNSKLYDLERPDMNQKRAGLGCATFYSKGHDERPILIAAGTVL